ncbi:MAG TPA: hypothetical protein VGC67_11825 [Cellulomonas sp.]
MPEQTLRVLELLAEGVSRQTTARRLGLSYSRVMAVAATHGWPDRGALVRAARTGRAGLPVARELRSIEELVRWAEDSGIDAVAADARRVRVSVERLRRRIERLYATAARPSGRSRSGGAARRRPVATVVGS